LYKGHGIELAKEAIENGAEKILVVGGDGSINDVINGIMTFKQSKDISHIQLGLIPLGTGNDWGRYWKIPKKSKRAVEVFLNGNSTLVDIGCVTYQRNNEKQEHHFINSAGFGLDCNVVIRAEKLKRYIGSHSILYFLSLLFSIFKQKTSNITIKDSKTTYDTKLYTINIGNGCYSGGGMKQNPNADPTDGVFDTMIMKKPTMKYVITAITCLFNGTLLMHPAITTFKSKEIKLEGEEYLSFEADGVVVHAFAPYHITIIPKAIRMIH
jgi:diacylglycerol kinase (ATP)